jgi:hypothetical protein
MTRRATLPRLVASAAVYLAPDDAKTDVILAAATTIFGVAARGLVVSLPPYPRTGVIGAALDVAWILALTALVPILLARHRGDGRAAFGLDGPPRGLLQGLVMAASVVALGVGSAALQGGGAGSPALLGRLGRQLMIGGPVGVALVTATVGAFSLGALVLVGFLAVRSRDGFPRSPELSLTAVVRMTGTVAVAVAAVLGTLLALGPARLLPALLHVAALSALLLLVDRSIPAGVSVPRAVVLGPVTVVVASYVLAAGGIFRGDLAGGLYVAALALGGTIAIAALAHTPARAWTAVPVVVAVHWWPTCLTPLALAGGVC